MTHLRKSIGWFCTYTPEEIILAAGFYPVRISPELNSPKADAYLDANFCPYVRTILGEALENRYHSLVGIIVANSCDGMRRLYDALRYYTNIPFIYLLDVPRTQSESGVTAYRESLLQFVQIIGSRFEVSITNGALAGAISTCNRTRTLLARLHQARLEGHLHLSGEEFFQIVRKATCESKEIYNGSLETLLEKHSGDEIAQEERPRVLITGTLMDNPQFLSFIEDAGGEVFWEDLCTGERYFNGLVATGDDPILALSKRYLLKSPCPRMQETKKRIEYLLGLIEAWQIDGVILFGLKFCDPFLYELPLLKREMGKRHIPFLFLEGDYSLGAVGRLRTRIEAFFEMIKFGSSSFSSVVQ
jgi:benzoyl-CoA reductase/2-hydroxyglutaryl-CoA dehydratase subunit BcrC/BadD/HgdB